MLNAIPPIGFMRTASVEKAPLTDIHATCKSFLASADFDLDKASQDCCEYRKMSIRNFLLCLEITFASRPTSHFDIHFHH